MPQEQDGARETIPEGVGGWKSLQVSTLDRTSSLSVGGREIGKEKGDTGAEQIMSRATAIEWTDETWNPVRGCALVSAGCANCYAMKQAHRFSGEGMPYAGLTELGPQGPRWTGAVRLVPDVLDAPLRWKQPRRIFVNSMSDLFHEEVPDEFIDRVFDVMEGGCLVWREGTGTWSRLPWHTFQILTKRPARMLAYMTSRFARKQAYAEQFKECPTPEMRDSPAARLARQHADPSFHPHIHLGVSIEDQRTADARIPILLQTPAAVRFVSAEPLLGAITFAKVPGFNRVGSAGREILDRFWVIVGGESGPGARPCDVAWIRSIVEQCQAAAVPCFVKQLGTRPFDGYDGGPIRYGDTTIDIGEKKMWMELNDKKGGDPAEWPADLRVREWPR